MLEIVLELVPLVQVLFRALVLKLGLELVPLVQVLVRALVVKHSYSK